MNLRYTVSFARAFIARFKVLLLVGILFGFLGFIGLRYVAPLIFDKEVERVGRVGRFSTSELPPDILNLIGMGLTTIGKEGEAKEGIAKSWEVSNDGKTWAFHINDLKWQDGTAVTSNDINYSFEDVEVQKPDKKTIVFKLSSSFAPFPMVVSKPVFKKGLLGTGEWKVTDLSLVGSAVERITLGSQGDGGKVKIIKFYPSEERLKLAFKLGEVDKIEEIFDPKPFNNWTNSAQVNSQVNLDKYVGVFFNVEDKLLSSKDLRQALSYAIDKKRLSPNRAYGPISPESWAYNSQTKPYDFDQARSREIIENSKQLSSEQKKNLKIKLTTTPPLLSQAEKIVQNWKEIGVDATVQVATTIPSEFQAFLVVYDIPSDPDQYSTWHSKGANNISRYNDRRIGKLLEDGRLELDQEERKRIYMDFQRFLAEDAPVAFLYHPETYTVSRK